MPYSDGNLVQDPAAGQPIQAALLDAYRANQEYFARNKPRCRVFNNANISIANNTITALTFNSERYDTGGVHSTVSNTSRLTVPTGEAGVYHIGGSFIWANNTTGRRTGIIRINGTTTIAQLEPADAPPGGESSVCLSTDYALVAGDYVELLAFQTSGGALNVLASGNNSPEFWMRWCSL